MSEAVILHHSKTGTTRRYARGIGDHLSARDVDFREADLRGARVTGTDLLDSLFGRTNLAQADFREVRNYRITLGECTLTGARFALPEALSLLYALDIDPAGN